MKEAWVLTHLRSIQFNCCCRRRRHQTRTWFGMTRLTECEKEKERTDTHWWDTRVCCLVEGKPVRCDRIHAIWFVRSLVRLCHYFECVQHTKLKCNIDCSRRQKRETPLFPQQMFCLSFALVGCLLNHFSFIPHHHHHHLFRSLVGFNENGVGLRRGGGQETDRTYNTKRGDTILWEREGRKTGGDTIETSRMDETEGIRMNMESRATITGRPNSSSFVVVVRFFLVVVVVVLFFGFPCNKSKSKSS